MDNWSSWLTEAREVWCADGSLSDEIKEKKQYCFVFENQFRRYQCRLPSSRQVQNELVSINQWILQHDNGIGTYSVQCHRESIYSKFFFTRLMIIGISDTHPLVTAALQWNILSLDSKPRISVKFIDAIIKKEISGKRKRGAVQSQPTEIICHVTIPIYVANEPPQSEIFQLKGCVFGSIIEYNYNLEDLLNNITSKPTSRVRTSEAYLWLTIVSGHSNSQVQKSLSTHSQVPFCP